jgi:uncharacterized protein (TIGR03083 family)
MDQAGRIGHLEADGAEVSALVGTHGTSAAVEHCGGWRVGDLVRHLGSVHRWATRVVGEGHEGWFTEGGPDDDDLPVWFADGHRLLVETLRGTNPDDHVWTFGFPPERMWFWSRRQCLETAVHRWDVQHAVGVPAGVATELALDGIGEVVEFFFPRQVTMKRTARLPAPVRIEAVDADRSWTLGGDPADCRATMTGTAAQLFLQLWGRGTGDVGVEGDPDVLDALAAAVMVP